MKIEVHSPTIRRKEMDAVLTAMVDDQIGPGERSRFFIQTAKEYIRFDYALALRSPATALHLALKTLNLKEGDGVIVSALSPRYYAQVLSDLHLTPLYCDVSYSFPCISRESIEKAISAKPSDTEVRCIILHHTLGFVPDTASIIELDIPVIEDISQSYVPSLNNQQKAAEKTESNFTDNTSDTVNAPEMTVRGVFAILGLEERDMLTAGGGALLFAMNRKDGILLRAYSNIAPEFCLPDINAAMAAVQFRETARNIARRNEIAQVYLHSSLSSKHKRFVPLDTVPYNNYSFPLVLETGMKDVVSYARKKEIIVENAFEQSLAGAGICDSIICPVSYSLSLRTVLFPLYPRLRSQDAQRVSRLIMTLP